MSHPEWKDGASVSEFLLILGLGLELGGIAAAIWGLADVRDEFFEGLRFPHRRIADLLPVRLKRAFGWRPTMHYVEAHGTAHATGSARVGIQVTRARPANDASLAEWNRYWGYRLDDLQRNLDSFAEEMRDADKKNMARIVDEVSRLEGLIAQLGNEVRVVAGGKGGGGLIKAWYALVAIGLGGFLQIIGVLIG